MYNYVKTIELLVKALESRGKYYNITSKRYRLVQSDGTIRYGRRFKYVDIENKDNYIETSNNKEVLEYLLSEWNRVKKAEKRDP